jgi:hypothetical protein
MSEVTVETLLNQFELLPAVERKRLFAALVQKLNGAVKPTEKIKYREPIPMPDYEPIANWIREHRDEYGGQWVALDSDRLIAYGEDSRAMFAAARADGAKMPFVTFIEPADAPPFMGF